MSKKKLDTTNVLNELKNGSVFFQGENNLEKSERPVRPDDSERGDGPERPVRIEKKKREIRRHSYEIYQDQVLKLQQLKVEFMMKGELKSMSSMVRDAIDSYLDNNQTRSDRTPRTE
jgi:hypothetical protein